MIIKIIMMILNYKIKRKERDSESIDPKKRVKHDFLKFHFDIRVSSIRK